MPDSEEIDALIRTVANNLTDGLFPSALAACLKLFSCSGNPLHGVWYGLLAAHDCVRTSPTQTRKADLGIRVIEKSLVQMESETGLKLQRSSRAIVFGKDLLTRLKSVRAGDASVIAELVRLTGPDVSSLESVSRAPALDDIEPNGVGRDVLLSRMAAVDGSTPVNQVISLCNAACSEGIYEICISSNFTSRLTELPVPMQCMIELVSLLRPGVDINAEVSRVTNRLKTLGGDSTSKLNRPLYVTVAMVLALSVSNSCRDAEQAIELFVTSLNLKHQQWVSLFWMVRRSVWLILDPKSPVASAVTKPQKRLAKDLLERVADASKKAKDNVWSSLLDAVEFGCPSYGALHMFELHNKLRDSPVMLEVETILAGRWRDASRAEAMQPILLQSKMPLAFLDPVMDGSILRTTAPWVLRRS